ncbi:hypothetical protein J6590_094317, partial [Homalodisca vitripennis]
AYERSTTQTAECKTAEQEDQDQTVYSMVDIDCKNDLRDSNIQSTTENRCVQLSSGLINDTVEVDTIDSDELTWKTVSYKKSSSFDQSKSEKCVKGKEPRPIIGLVNKKGNQYGRVTKPVIIGSNTQRGGLKSVEKFKWVFISRCAPDTSVDDIVGYVTVDGVEVSKSEKLKTKYSDYSSFKVCILDKHFERVLCPDFWPEGVFVKEYDPPRNTFKSTNGPGVGVKPGNFLGKRYRRISHKGGGVALFAKKHLSGYISDVSWAADMSVDMDLELAMAKLNILNFIIDIYHCNLWGVEVAGREESSRPTQKKISRRVFSDANVLALKAGLAGESWDNVYDAINLDEKWKSFIDTLLWHLDVNCPIKKMMKC